MNDRYRYESALRIVSRSYSRYLNKRITYAELRADIVAARDRLAGGEGKAFKLAADGMDALLNEKGRQARRKFTRAERILRRKGA
jgi:hypothetical protein